MAQAPYSSQYHATNEAQALDDDFQWEDEVLEDEDDEDDEKSCFIGVPTKHGPQQRMQRCDECGMNYTQYWCAPCAQTYCESCWPWRKAHWQRAQGHMKIGLGNQ